LKERLVDGNDLVAQQKRKQLKNALAKRARSRDQPTNTHFFHSFGSWWIVQILSTNGR